MKKYTLTQEYLMERSELISDLPRDSIYEYAVDEKLLSTIYSYMLSIIPNEDDDIPASFMKNNLLFWRMGVLAFRVDDKTTPRYEFAMANYAELTDMLTLDWNSKEFQDAVSEAIFWFPPLEFWLPYIPASVLHRYKSIRAVHNHAQRIPYVSVGLTDIDMIDKFIVDGVDPQLAFSISFVYQDENQG